MPSPMVLTLKWFRDKGGIANKTEHWNHFANKRQDLFNFADLIAILPDKKGTTYIQCTTGDNFSARRKKILANPYVRPIIKAGNHVEVFGWRKVGPRGKRKIYEARIDKITMEDLKNEKTCDDIDVSNHDNDSSDATRGRDKITQASQSA